MNMHQIIYPSLGLWNGQPAVLQPVTHQQGLQMPFSTWISPNFTAFPWASQQQVMYISTTKSLPFMSFIVTSTMLSHNLDFQNCQVLSQGQVKFLIQVKPNIQSSQPPRKFSIPFQIFTLIICTIFNFLHLN